MKKIILLATILLITGTVSAQTYFNGDRADFDYYYQPKFGFEVSANFVNTTSAANFNTGSTAGFAAGFNVDLPVAYPLSIMPAVMFSQKGFTATTQAGNYTQLSQAIEVPVLAKFRSGSAFNFYIGPQVSYLISTTTKFSKDFSSGSRESYQYSGSNILYQGVIGIGINITKSTNIHTRYAFDLQGTNANGNNAIPSYHSHAWQVGFGFSI